MKKIKFLLMLLLGVVMSVSFVSCGDDDDDDNNSGPYVGSAIVGSWACDFADDKSDRPLIATYTFKADGTFTHVYDGGKDTEHGTFQYDKDNNILILVITNATNEKRIGTKTYKIELVANSYFIIDYDKYYKQ